MDKTLRQDTLYIFITPIIELVVIGILIPQGPLEVPLKKDVFYPTILAKWLGDE